MSDKLLGRGLMYGGIAWVTSLLVIVLTAILCLIVLIDSTAVILGYYEHRRYPYLGGMVMGAFLYFCYVRSYLWIMNKAKANLDAYVND